MARAASGWNLMRTFFRCNPGKDLRERCVTEAHTSASGWNEPPPRRVSDDATRCVLLAHLGYDGQRRGDRVGQHQFPPGTPRSWICRRTGFVMEHRSRRPAQWRLGGVGGGAGLLCWRRSPRRTLATLSSRRLPQLGQGPLLDCTDPLLTHSKLAGNHG